MLNNKYAIKILYRTPTSSIDKLRTLLRKEVESLAKFTHNNIVKLIEYSEKAIIKKQHGLPDIVMFIALELITGGELLDYVASFGGLPENIARLCFQEIVDAINYIHSLGVCHRDLKVDNIMVDSSYCMKLVDFGFSQIVDKYSDTYLRTWRGTEIYMAPEIKLHLPYKGTAVDIFTLGVILFTLISGHIPFREATKNDVRYNLIIEKKSPAFWLYHMKNKPLGFYSDNIKSLIDGMLCYDPNQRFKMLNIIEHPWCKEPACTMDERAREFIKRKKLKEEFEQKNCSPTVSHTFTQIPLVKAPYKSLTVKTADCPLELYVHEDDVYKPCSIVTRRRPTEVMGIISASLDKCGFKKLKLVESKSKYKVTATMMGQNGEFTLNWKIEILEEALYNVSFMKKKGDRLEFLEYYRMAINGTPTDMTSVRAQLVI